MASQPIDSAADTGSNTPVPGAADSSTEYAELCDQLGARLLHSLSDQQLIAQQLQHTQLINELLSQGYRHGNLYSNIDELQFSMLRLLLSHTRCQSALLVEIGGSEAPVTVLASLGSPGSNPGFTFNLPPSRLVKASEPPQAGADWLRNLAGQPALAWFLDTRTGRALLLGQSAETDQHRPFSPLVLQLLSTINQLLSEMERRLNSEEQVRRQITRDPLTRLPNQMAVMEQLHEAIEQANNHPDHPGFHLLRLNVDNFRRLNELMGHENGDTLLCEIAERLQSLLPGASVLSRLGGDEFMLLLKNSDSQTVSLLCRDMLRHASGSYNIAGHTPLVTLSLGVVACPQDGSDSVSLLKFSDLALEQAKRDGRNRFHFYSADLTERQAKHWQLRSDLQQAVERQDQEQGQEQQQQQQLKLFYQPIFDLNSRQLIQFEALLRWEHPVLGPVSPAEFIPLAEADDTIVRLGDWVVQEICRQLAEWRDQGRQIVPVAINISARQLQQADFADRLLHHLQHHSLTPQHIELELTERLLLQQETVGEQLFSRLAEQGFSLELDDFGTGYSALSYLTRYPFSVLKIDRSFIDKMEHNPRQQTLVSGVVGLARKLGLKTIAEGVETQEQLAALKAMECDMAQGYLLGRPAPAASIMPLLSTRQRPEADGDTLAKAS